MALRLQNPLVLLSLNVCGVGLDVAACESLPDETEGRYAVTVCVNFLFGRWSGNFWFGRHE